MDPEGEYMHMSCVFVFVVGAAAVLPDLLLVQPLGTTLARSRMMAKKTVELSSNRKKR